MGQNYIFSEQTKSTNEDARRLLLDNPPEGTVIQTHFQSEGKGQRGNQWHSRKGENLLMSVILYPKSVGANEIFLMNMISSLAVYETVRVILKGRKNISVKIKWPNDILVDKKKIAGILVENQLTGGKIKSSVIGIGLNVNQKNFPEETKDTATSFALLKKNVSLDKAREILLEQLEKWYLKLQSYHSDQLRKKYTQNLFFYRQSADFTIEGKKTAGIINGVNAEGKLSVRINGTEKFFSPKEIVFLTAERHVIR